MNLLVVLPVVIPVFTAALLILTGKWAHIQRYISAGGSVLFFFSTILLFAEVLKKGYLVTYIGGWQAPFGIVFVADIFAAIMVVTTGLLAVCIIFYSVGVPDTMRTVFGSHVFLQVMLAGVCGAFLTGDLFNLFVWFEVMLMSSFVLLALGGRKAQMEGALKYVSLNLLASVFFLAGVGMVYGVFSTLNMAALSVAVAEYPNKAIAIMVAMPLMVAFSIKSAVFPVYSWLPASYHTPPIAVTAIFAGLLTKVGVYSLIRMFTLVFTIEIGFTHSIFLAVGLATMFIGVLGAVAQDEFRKILSVHIISQIGYMVMGLALFTPFALAATIIYIVHNMLVKSNLFLVSGLAQRLNGTLVLKHMGGLAKLAPWLAALFLINALSLAGVPPLSGFWAKLTLVQSAVAVEEWFALAVALGVGALTLFSMIKIWLAAFWKPPPEDSPIKEQKADGPIYKQGVPVVVLTVTILAFGFAIGPIFDIAERAGEQLMNPQGYVQAVLGGNR